MFVFPTVSHGFNSLSGRDGAGQGTFASFFVSTAHADDFKIIQTLQTIAFSAYLRECRNTRPFLVVCPLSVLHNWYDEYQKFAPSVGVFCLLRFTSTQLIHARYLFVYTTEPQPNAPNCVEQLFLLPTFVPKSPSQLNLNQQHQKANEAKRVPRESLQEEKLQRLSWFPTQRMMKIMTTRILIRLFLSF